MAKNSQQQNKEIGYIKPREITEEMQESYLDYAMSVIISRALPDVRDGLKPVHRKILYAMYEMGLKHNTKFRKSATVVGECFAKNTLVLTTIGLIPIQDIEIGSKVFTQDGVRNVVKLYEMPKKSLLEVTLENGISNVVTPSQKFKVLRPDWRFEWKEAKNLTPDDHIVVRADYSDVQDPVRLSNFEKNQPKYLNKNIAYFLGIFVSEGSISEDYSKKKLPRISFTNCDKNIMEKVSSIVQEEFNYTPTIEEKDYEPTKKGSKVFKKQYVIRINRKSINDFFTFNFDLKGKRALTKEIPSQILISSLPIIFSFISGLIDGDGSVHKSRQQIHYGSISQRLINQLQVLLQHQGIFSAKHKDLSLKSHYIGDHKVNNRYPFYYLEIQGENAIKLVQHLCLISHEKQERVFRIIKNKRRMNGFRADIIPFAGRMIFEELSQNHLGGGWYQDTNEEKFRMGIKYKTGCKIRYSSDIEDKALKKTQVIDWGIEEKLKRIGSPIFEFLNYIRENKIYFLRVSSIKKVVPEKTYDLEVERDHEFIANGMVSHNCLGKYHPHGDVAVYDALVRMAQDFSLRYPLIEGQGNFGCFTKDTEVRLTDGRNLSFGDLIREQKQGKLHWTLAFNRQTKKVEISEIKNPRLTRKREQIMEVTLDSGKKIKCTLDHRFLLRNGTYKKAKELEAGNSLMPLYTKLFEGNDKNLKGYEIILQPIKGDWEFLHHLADSWNLGNGVYERKAGRIRHHKDFNKLNNNPNNISRIQWQDHWKFHKEIASERHKTNMEYVKKLANGRRKYIENNRHILAERARSLNRKLWKDPKFRERHSRRIKQLWQDPEYKEYMRQLSSRNLKKLWKRKDFQELLSNLKSREMKQRWQNEKYREFWRKRTREISLEIWADPKHRERMSKLMKKRFQDPEARMVISNKLKELWTTPEYRAKYPKDHFIEMARKLWENPKIKELHRERAIQQWQNIGFRKKIIKAVRARNKARLKEKPNFMRELTEKAKISLRKSWKDPSYKKRVIKSKILGYVRDLSEKHLKVTPQIYERERSNNGVPKIENALLYFSDLSEIIEKAKSYNHKVVATRILPERMDVYDLTTEPQHNFLLAAGVFVHNSIDGDESAHMRYTEARLSPIGEDMLKDIERDTVEFRPNYDETRKEPVVLPSPLPQLLLNGSLGIAVGMATNIPPHNVSEILCASIHLVDNPSSTTEDLFEFLQGPDFPTGGIIYGKKDIIAAYSQGKGPILIRGKAEIQELKKGNFQILISEIPFQVQKAELVKQMAKLVEEKKMEGIKDIRDESDREGMRIVIELKREAFPRKVLNALFKFTDLQKSFHLNMLALVDGVQPKVLSLVDVLNLYLLHKKEVVLRRTRFDLESAKERAHILEGFVKALKNIDAVIQTIKKSSDRADAGKNLKKKFKFTTLQAIAILEMRLQSLAKLEREKIEQELKEIKEKIKGFTLILQSPKKVKEVIKKELKEMKEKYQDGRKTKVMTTHPGEIQEEDLVPEEETIIILTRGGFIKRVKPSLYKIQHRGGKGILGIEVSGEDAVEHFLAASTHDKLLFFTDSGKVFQCFVWEIPELTRTSKGRGLLNFLELSPQDKVLNLIPYGKEDEEATKKYLVMVTKNGIIKKTDLATFKNVRRNGLIAIRLQKDDLLCRANIIEEGEEIILVTKDGKSIRFKQKDLRVMGRAAAGVRGIRLAKGPASLSLQRGEPASPAKRGEDEVVGMDIIKSKINPAKAGQKSKISGQKAKIGGQKSTLRQSSGLMLSKVEASKISGEQKYLLIVTENGYGKRTRIKDYRIQKRGGSGIKTARVNEKTGKIVFSRIIGGDEKDLIVISEKGQIIRSALGSISILGRAASGVRVMRLDRDDKVASAICL